MDTTTFNEIIEAQIERSRSVLVKKAGEYATEDRLHNFKVAAQLQGINPAQALRGMLAKHTVSVFDMINSGKHYPQEVWDEKITDSINYHLLLRALVEEPGGTYKPVFDVNSIYPGREYMVEDVARVDRLVRHAQKNQTDLKDLAKSLFPEEKEPSIDDQIGVEAAEALWAKVAKNVEDYSATQFEPPVRIRRTEEMEHRPRVISRMRANLERPLEPWEEDLLNGGQETQTNGEGEDPSTWHAAKDTQTVDDIVRVLQMGMDSSTEHEDIFALLQRARPNAFPEPRVEDQVEGFLREVLVGDSSISSGVERIIRAVKGE